MLLGTNAAFIMVNVLYNSEETRQEDYVVGTALISAAINKQLCCR